MFPTKTPFIDKIFIPSVLVAQNKLYVLCIYDKCRIHRKITDLQVHVALLEC